MANLTQIATTNVSIRAPAWGATRKSRRALPIWECFNPRSRVGSDVTHNPLKTGVTQFQSALPRGERPRPAAMKKTCASSFNPRSRVGSDWPALAPSWQRCSFNPRSRVGSDLDLLTALLARTCFNPRSRVGSDVTPNSRHKGHAVSIRAPAWGATCANPICNFYGYCFNPRSRVGSDGCSVLRLHQRPVSIRAPAWGATLASLTVCLRRLVSIRAPAWGATGQRLGVHRGGACFNPRSRVGSDRHYRHADVVVLSFNPRSRVGSDLWRLASCTALDCFNPRSRVGSDLIGRPQ